jgi:hypothetical protein
MFYKKGLLIMRYGCVVFMLIIMLSLCAASAWAAPSGLNNIPTADVAPTNVLVLQAFSSFGQDTPPSWFAGFKYGVLENLEAGIDGRLDGPGANTDPALQVKYRFPLDPQTALAAGIANITGDTDKNGNTFPYLVLSHDFTGVRGHLGYSFENDNQALFVGLDKAVNTKLTLRADWIQVADGHESLSSLGFISPLNKDWLVEGWATFPSQNGAQTGYVLKLDYVLPRL